MTKLYKSIKKVFKPVGRFIKRWRVPFITAAVVLVAVGAVAYWRFGIFDRPGAAWRDMLTSSLATTSLTLQTDQSANGNSRQEIVEYTTGKLNQARSTTIVKQAKDIVQLETLGTFDADYTRYTNINVSGQSHANALNVWAKEDHASQATSNHDQLLPDAVLRLASGFGIPFGSVPLAQQADLLKQLNQGVVTTDTKQAKEGTVDGQKVFIYEATINPAKYAAYLKAFATALGFKQLSSYDASQASQQADIKVTLAVSRSSHHLVQLSYPELAGYTETYSHYNQPFQPLSLPSQTITYDELQQRLAQN